MTEAQRRGGVVANSGGNHAQGVAAAAKAFGMPATILMPTGVPEIKVARTRSHGAEVVFYDRIRDDRENMAVRLAAERGAVVVPSYDDPYIIAGQGTVGLEMIEQARQSEAVFDTVLIPCGGGGLTAGCALAFWELSPKTEIYLVEPEGFDDTKRSLEAGKRLTNETHTGSICDALLSPSPGALTFAINRDHVTGGLTVNDDDVRRAMAFAFFNLKLVIEPGGAVALAAALGGKIPAAGKTLGIVCTGGNVEAATFIEALTIFEKNLSFICSHLALQAFLR